ncbi:glycosyltransferase family 2 protein [Jiulongibacter sp. NS-SX5]|uniref:glycosyltransferase family 2 protein n=1 Tax=Jiulongibacter sp. NS-SX5 TaxID=3463854 RepID=UPI00405876E3
MNSFLSYGLLYLKYGIIAYSVFIISSYVILSIISISALKAYLKKAKYTNYEQLLPSFITPKVSLIAPAYNEGLTIVENIRSLLSLHYTDYEVIIVNDGSKDDSLQKAINAYKLVVSDMEYAEDIPGKPVKHIYKSKLPEFKNLIVVDKVNGGKADALNVGINVSSAQYVACIDVDCLLEQDALLKLVKRFLDSKKRVIATGGVIRIINSCEVKNGAITQVHVPKNQIARMQVLEYLRAFLLGRMAWGKLSGLLIISGAFGMFDKEIVKAVGGYDTKTVGEDMELVVRMRRFMKEQKQPYEVRFIPDPLCWTEAPESHKILGRQRNRWTRGTIETLWIHRKMFFNPKYGVIGILSYPYWFFFEFLAPLLEFGGLILFLILALLGMVNWPFFYAITAVIYTFAFMLNMLAIYAEEITYYQYKDPKDIWRLVISAIAEPVLYHPFLVWSAIRGHIDKIKGKKTWGEMTRVGIKST